MLTRIMTVLFIGRVSACVAFPATAQKRSANPLIAFNSSTYYTLQLTRSGD
jgi:hypothetical protein